MRQNDGRQDRVAAWAVLGLGGALVAAGCGGGGGSAPKDPPDQALYAKSISVPNYTGIFLDEDIRLEFSAPVKEGSINPDSIRIRTGPTGGIAPFGEFVRGIFMVDKGNGNRIVIDRDQITENLVGRVERSGNPGRIADNIRFDLGNDSPPGSNGVRRPLFDRSEQATITFVPEIPTRAALDDTGYGALSTYAVIVPGYPTTNTLENLAGSPALSPGGRVFTSTFTTVPLTASKVFLGAESAGVPRVIHSSPFNGSGPVALTDPIKIRMSQPLDPRTVDVTQFSVELVSVPAPYPQIPVSVFLAQQRLGKCEITLTPINPLPSDGVIRVTMGTGIEDLLGQAINPTVLSFSTGFGPPIDVGPFEEEFSTNTYEDAANTTAVWNGNKPYVDATPGELKAAFAPYAGDGSDGAFTATIGITTTLNTGSTVQRVYNYTTFTIPIGATVVASGSHPLVIRCQGAIDISGALLANGASGGIGFSSTDNSTSIAQGGTGGIAGAGGGPGGGGAFAVIGGGGNMDGLDGVGPGKGLGGFTGQNDSFDETTDPFWPRAKFGGADQSCQKATPGGAAYTYAACRQRECGGGGGYSTAGGDGDNDGATELSRNGATTPNGGKGGVTWGSATFSNASTSATVLVKDTGTGGTKTITLNGVPTLVAQQGGSGGGGGGGEDDRNSSNLLGTADSGDEGGGGGGGGGGAIQLVSYLNITVSGRVSCNGGRGGNTSVDEAQTDFGEGAGGGGGSGGSIWIQCRGTATVNSGAIMEALGGSGGSGYADGSSLVYVGGSGGEGRIRVEDGDGIISLPGTVQPNASTAAFAPALDLDSVALSQWISTGIFTPDFSQPIVDAAVLPAVGPGGAIRIFLEGAPEDVNTAVDDPFLAASTTFIKVYDTDIPGGFVAGNPWDLLDNNKWWRFKVEFHVDAFHTFTDPLPTVRALTVTISQ